MSKVRAKISSNGFTRSELLSFRKIYRELKRVYHPDLTSELTLEKVIIEESSKSFSLTKYYMVAIILSVLTALLFGRVDYLFMPGAFIILTIFDIRASAKNGRRSIPCELKLMKLAVRMWL